MAVYIPCLNVQEYDKGGGWSVGLGVGPGTNSDGIASGSVAPGISVTHSSSPITLTVAPIPPFIFFGPNFAFWSGVFGLGQTKIERQKVEIQDFYTPIFRYLNRTYGVPLRDNHALQFDFDGVKRQFQRHPELKALQSLFISQADDIVLGAFGYDSSGDGIRERIVNQFLANAGINDWPSHATREIWDGIREASSLACHQDTLRWYRDPYFLRYSATLGLIQQWVPLTELIAWDLRGGINHSLNRALIDHWSANPFLVAEIPPALASERPAWLIPYTGAPNQFNIKPFGDNEQTPLESRPSYQHLLKSVTVPQVYYPDFSGAQTPPIWVPPQQPQPPTVPQEPTPVPAPQPEPTPTPQPEPIPTPQPTPVPAPQPSPFPDIQSPVLDPQITPLPPGQVLTLPGQWPPTQPGQVLEIPPAPRQPDPPPVPQDCPPFPTPQQPTPQPQPQPYPLPDDQDGQPQPQPQGGPCPPNCQEQIDFIWRRQQECCDQTQLVVIPRLDDLTRWVNDLENRVPGPAPELPRREVPPEERREPEVSIPPVEEIPTTPIFPTLPPEVEDRLKQLEDCCDPAKEEERHKELERPLECVTIPLCGPEGGPWGAMAECWLRENTPYPDDILGVLRGRQYPQSPVAAVVNTWNKALRGSQSGQEQQSQTGSVVAEQGPLARFNRLASYNSEMILSVWNQGVMSPTGDTEAGFALRSTIFTDSPDTPEPTIRYRSVALRSGDIDPCSGVAEDVLEIP